MVNTCVIALISIIIVLSCITLCAMLYYLEKKYYLIVFPSELYQTSAGMVTRVTEM